MKNRGEKTREKFFKKHTNRVYKNCWKKKSQKSAKNFFKKITMEKNRLEKVRKHVFYKHTNIVTKKWWEKTREIFFSRNTRISRIINDGKKSSGKSAKTRFL